MKTLNEVVNIVGLKRRAIQEYEDAGLAEKPKTKNKYGYLLYDTPAIERLWNLRFYKELGYNRTQIKNIFDCKTLNTEDELSRVIQELIEKREKLDNLIGIAQGMKKTGISFSSFKKHMIDDDMDAEEVFGVLGTSLNLFMDVKEEDCNMEFLKDSDLDDIYGAIKRIDDLQKEGRLFDCAEVQAEIVRIHNIIAKGLSKSIIFFRNILMYIEPENKVTEDLELFCNIDNLDFFRSAMSYYCDLNEDNETDRELCEALDNISILGIKKYATNSPEVQAEVVRIHNFFKEVNMYKEEAKLEMVRKIGHLFGSKAYKQMIDNGANKGIAWFVSRAIEIYCENKEKEGEELRKTKYVVKRGERK